MNFFSSIIEYISLFTSLSIPLYALREIAEVHDNEKERNRVAIEMLLRHACVWLINLRYVAVAILTVTVTRIQIDRYSSKFTCNKKYKVYLK
jgi:hypothetical protein